MSFSDLRVRKPGSAPQRALRLSLLAVMVASGIAQAAETTNTASVLHA